MQEGQAIDRFGGEGASRKLARAVYRSSAHTWPGDVYLRTELVLMTTAGLTCMASMNEREPFALPSGTSASMDSDGAGGVRRKRPHARRTCAGDPTRACPPGSRMH